MSWSVNYIGTPENISKKLEENSSKLEGKSKEEYDEALPHLQALVKMNYNKQYAALAISITANGHAYSDGKDNGYSNCNVTIVPVGSQLV